MKKFWLFLLMAGAAIACSESGGESEKDIDLAPDTPKKYTVYADDTSCTASSNGISFTTTGPWRALVEESRAEVSDGGSVSWVTVTPDRGDAAGDYSITIQLGVNTSGKDRKATITIECGATKITIVVEQKGKTEAGDVPETPVAASKFVSKIDETISSWSGCLYDYFYTVSYAFKYDDRNRVTEMTARKLYYDGDEACKRTLKLAYSDKGTIDIVSDTGRETVNYTATMDGSGRISRIEHTSGYSGVYDFTYDTDGRLVRESWENNNGTGYRTFTYKDGVLSGGTIADGDGENETSEGGEKMFGNIRNDMLNIDPNMIFIDGLLYDMEYIEYDLPSAFNCLAMLRLMGRGSDRCLGTYYGGDDEAMGAANSGWPEPNVVVHKSSEFCEHEYEGTLRYELAQDGSLSGISHDELCKQIRREYDIVSGSELIDPLRPMFGYKYSIANDTRTVLGTGKYTHTYGFTYR